MLYAGIEKVYVYDTGGTFSKHDGRVEDLPGVAELIAAGIVTIYTWLVPNWRKSHGAAMKYQLDFYQDSRKKHPRVAWRTYLDWDEFVFSPNDTDAGFLRRYLKNLSSDTGLVLMQNTIFGGIDRKETHRNISSKTHGRPERFVWREPDRIAEKNKLRKYVAIWTAPAVILSTLPPRAINSDHN